MEKAPENLTEKYNNSQVRLNFTDAHIGCPFSFIVEGYTVELLKRLYPFTKRERKDGVERFEVWYKLWVTLPAEPKWERLMPDEMLPNNIMITEWRMIDPLSRTKVTNKVKLIRA